MKKLLMAILGSFAMLTGLAGAQTPVKDALPPGPLIVTHMPEFAQWSIEYTYASMPKAGQTSGEASQKVRLSHVLVTKADDVIHEERNFEGGLTGELWANREIVAEREPKPAIIVPALSNNMSEHPFPDFDWISGENFKGIQTHNGTKCMAFEAAQYNFAHDLIGTADAWVDVATRCPVGYQLNEETRSYKMMDAPQNPLVIPDEFLAAARQLQEHVRRATPHLATP